MTRRLILVVDDVDDNRELYAEYLDLAGFRAITAADGKAALALAAAEKPDLILLDLSLSGMDGCEVAARLKRDARTRQIPIIAITGHAQPEYAQRAREAGCDAFFTKPCPPARLTAEMHKLVAGRGPSRAKA
jgi:CheY-like chemotaxis protein